MTAFINVEVRNQNNYIMKKFIVILAFMAAAVTLSAQNQKFGHVNYSEIIQLMAETDSARATMALAQQEANETFQGMVNEYNTKLEQYQQKRASWTPAVTESKERELQEIGQRIQDFEQSIQQELAQRQQALMMPIYQKASEAVKKVAKSLDLVYVYDVTSLLYFDETKSVDISKQLKAELGIPEDKVLNYEQIAQQLQGQPQQQ